MALVLRVVEAVGGNDSGAYHDASPDALDDKEGLDESGHLEVGVKEAIVGVDHGRLFGARTATQGTVFLPDDAVSRSDA